MDSSLSLGNVLPRGLIQLPADSELVTDADEEVFLVYTALQQASSSGKAALPSGLGHVDSRQDTLTVRFELQPPTSVPSDPGVRRSKNYKKEKRASDKEREKVVEVELAQDKTALRTRKGDTGSVLWRVSIEIAQLVLQQHHDHTKNSLFNLAKLPEARILELGAGTGLLSIVFAPLVQHYTVTDIPALLPLIRKNISINSSLTPQSKISVSDLDWESLLATTSSARPRLFPKPCPPLDLILAVDCVYHPSLLPAFVETIDYFAEPGRTAVVVAVELRAEDVVRELLELWCGRPGWEVRRVGGGLINLPYVVWVGWKEVTAVSNEE